MGRGLLPCFPALDFGGNDPFSVLLLNHAWGEGDVRSPRFYVANLGREVYFPGSFRMARQHIRPLPCRRLPQGAVIPN